MNVAQQARGWIGTPFVHGASLRGAGADCLGLVLGLWRDMHGPLPCAVPPYGPAWPATDQGAALLAALRTHLAPALTPQDGDVLVFRLQPAGIARHLGIQTGQGRAFIHACPRAGVVEAPLSRPWARRIVARLVLAPEGALIGE